MKTFLYILAAGFAACIYWAFAKKPISESGAWLISDPWGIVTLVDLYIGFLLFSFFMYFTVPQKSTLVIWVPALMILGNIIALLYLTFYYKKLTTILGVNNESV